MLDSGPCHFQSVFYCCPQPRAEPQSCPAMPSALALAHNGVLLSPWTDNRVLAGECPALNQMWAPTGACPPPAVGLVVPRNRLCARGAFSSSATSLWVGSWGSPPCSLQVPGAPEPILRSQLQLCPAGCKPRLARRVESRADRWDREWPMSVGVSRGSVGDVSSSCEIPSLGSPSMFL